jgi:hypothetical protein
MIVELAITVSSQDGNIERITYQRMLFPAPATKGENHQSRERMMDEQQLTLSVDPQKGARWRCLPLRERVALKEPHCGPFAV